MLLLLLLLREPLQVKITEQPGNETTLTTDYIDTGDNGDGASNMLIPNPKSDQSYRLTVRGDDGSDNFDDFTSNCGASEHKKCC